MSHFCVLVLTENGDHEKEVERLLAPYDENEEMFREGSRWDWWTIGGRWTGALDGYEPQSDPANIVRCSLCAGSGDRPGWVTYVDGERRFSDSWAKECNGCNGCKGKGAHVAWPTQWKEHDGDVQPVQRLLDAKELFVPLALVTPDGQWHERARMGWFGATIDDEQGDGEKSEDLWRAAVRALLEQHTEATAVLVDCHV